MPRKAAGDGAVVDVVARWHRDPVAVEQLSPAPDARACVRAGPFLVEVDGGIVRVDGARVFAPTRIERADSGAVLSLALRARAPPVREPFDVDADTIRAGAFGVGAVVALLAAFHVTPSPLNEDVLASPLPALRGAARGALVTTSFAPSSPAQRAPARASTRTRAPAGMFAPIERVDDDGAIALLGAIAELAERERTGNVDEIARLVAAIPSVASLAHADGRAEVVGRVDGPRQLGPPAASIDVDIARLLPIDRPADRHAPTAPTLGERRHHDIICRYPAGLVVANRSRDDIQRVVSRVHSRVRHCFERELAGASVAPITALTASWSIGVDGAVTGTRITSWDIATPSGIDVAACVVGVMSKLEFPPVDESAGVVEVNYPFHFSVAGGAP